MSEELEARINPPDNNTENQPKLPGEKQADSNRVQ
jgi:hypothetical protein